MRSPAITSLLLLVFSVAAYSQFTIQPQVGFETSRTTVSFNNLPSFVPLGGEFSPQVSLRLDYKFKQGFGPYIGISTSRSTINYSFSDLENGGNLFTATPGQVQFRFEGGYQFTTKAFSLGKSKQQTSPQKRPGRFSSMKRKNCGGQSSYRSHCADKSEKYSSGRCQGKSEKMKQAMRKNNPWIKLQPSAGIGFIPSVKPDVVSSVKGGQTNYEYRAGNWNTALMTGLGFEIGNNRDRLFTISLNYFNGFGNLTEQTITQNTGTKATTAHLLSDASGWNIRVGIPFTLSKNKPASKNKRDCGRQSYRSGCSQYKSAYRYRSIKL
jgi:hypothetical protein